MLRVTPLQRVVQRFTQGQFRQSSCLPQQGRSFSTTSPQQPIKLSSPSEDPALLGKHAKPAETPKETSPFVNPVTGEVNGPKGPEPTRYGDFERSGRCYDF